MIQKEIKNKIRPNNNKILYLKIITTHFDVVINYKLK